jgi:hypothetical protein
MNVNTQKVPFDEKITLESSLNEKVPLDIVFNRGSSDNDIIKLIKEAEKMLLKDNIKAKISRVRIMFGDLREGSAHPSQIRWCRKVASKAIDLGLIGLLHKFEYTKECQQIYAITHLDVRLRDGKLCFDNFDPEQYKKVCNESTIAFNKLV